MGQKQLLNKIEGGTTICIGDSVITASPCAKTIDAMLDSQVDMRTQVNLTCKGKLLPSEEHRSYPP